MDINPIRLFCQNASIEALQRVEQNLINGIANRLLANTNASDVLKLVQQEISERKLNALFDKD